MEDVMIIVAFLLLIFTAVGAIRYNTLRRKWAGVIGVGGSYVVLLGIMLLVSAIATLISVITGNGNSATTGETVMMIIVMLLALAYMVFVMLTRCPTTQQKILLPIVACLIGAGFIVRLLLGIFLHIPMESGKSSEAKFPEIIFDTQENCFRMTSESGDHADYYCQATGQTVQFYASDIADGLPNGCRRG